MLAFCILQCLVFAVLNCYILIHIFFDAQLEIYDGDTTEGLYSLVCFEMTQLGVTLQA